VTEDHPLDRALAHGLRGKFAAAERLLLDLRGDARAEFNLGWYLCRDRRWRDAAIHLDTGRMLNCYGSPPLRSGRPIWNEQPLDGRTVHLRCEGGYGDEIIGARWARNFAALGARVHVSCSPGLTSLLARAPGVSAVTAFQGADYVHCDYWAPAMSCPRWFEPTGETYLATDPRRWARWSEMIDGPRLRVGLRWAGNPKFEGQQYRKFPSQLMLDLVALRPDAQFYSLQVGNDLVELPSGVVDLAGRLTNWDETAAALAHLDLVITSCTGVAHCAAALGRPTWIVVPVMPYYLWAAPGERSVWYDSVRLFRQQEFGDWRAPFERVADELTRVRLVHDDSAFRPRSLEQAKQMVMNAVGTSRDGETEYLTNWLRGVVSSGDVVLDYGCGVGRVAKELVEKIGCQVVGVDNDDMLKFAREYVASHKFGCGHVPADKAICIFVLQHAERPDEVVDDVWRRLRPGGLFVTLDESRRLATLRTSQDKSPMFRDDGVALDDATARRFELVRQENFPWRDSRIKLWKRRDDAAQEMR
jgi:2-polyprenyl-3-methyl-5-hydroxy-6-metoxy-1,4-benzoquinol methylase